MTSYQIQNTEGSVRDVLRLIKYVSCNPNFANKYNSIDDFIIKKSKNSIKKAVRTVTEVFDKVSSVKPIVQNITRRFMYIYRGLYEDCLSLDEMIQKIIDNLYTRYIDHIDEEFKEDERVIAISKKRIDKLKNNISDLFIRIKKINDDPKKDLTIKEEAIHNLTLAIHRLKKELAYVKLDYVNKRLTHSIRALLSSEIKCYVRTKLYSSDQKIHVDLINHFPSSLTNLQNYEYRFLRKLFLVSICVSYRKSNAASDFRKFIPSMIYYQNEVIKYTNKQRSLYIKCLLFQ